MIPDQTVQTIKEAADILDVVARFVDLKKAGSRYVGLCPFHSERSPSFTVTPAKNMCKCFGCGKGGDAVLFLMEYKKLTYPEALEYLAGLYNIPIDTTGSKPKKDYTAPPRPAPPPPQQPSFFPKDKMLATLKAYGRNHFAQFLINRFGADVASDLIGRYFIGTSKHFSGGNIFWQIDVQGRVRGGKIMVYDPSTGKRDRSKMPTWTHKAAHLEDFSLSQCFHGEYLLSKRTTAPVCIVESEKTAEIASIYLPENIWLASGGKDGFGLNKCAVLKGRSVTLWPDASLPDKDGKTAFQLWSNKAAELNKAGYNVTVSNLIERLATDDERAKGFDLADYLLRFDLEAFHAKELPQDAPQLPTGHEREPDAPSHAQTDDGYPAAWDEPMPPGVSGLEVAAKLLAAHGWNAGRTQSVTSDSEKDWQASRERAQRLADWTDYKAGIAPNPYQAHSNYSR